MQHRNVVYTIEYNRQQYTNSNSNYYSSLHKSMHVFFNILFVEKTKEGLISARESHFRIASLSNNCTFVRGRLQNPANFFFEESNYLKEKL